MANKLLDYRVINLMNGQHWSGEAQNAQEAYKHIEIKAGDTTTVSYGKYGFAVKEWKKTPRHAKNNYKQYLKEKEDEAGTYGDWYNDNH